VAPAAAPSTAIKTWEGTDYSTVKTVVGVTRAQVKTITGLA
jgi:hypothetical protein